MGRPEDIRSPLRGGTVALALLTGVAVTPRVLASQEAPSGVHVTRQHVLVGSVGAVMSMGRVRLVAGASLPESEASSGRVWTFVAELRTNAPAEPVLRATALRGAWRRRLPDGTWAEWDGREVAVAGAFEPGVHVVEVVLHGPAEADPPTLAVRAVPAGASSGTPLAAPAGAFGAPRR